jgi:hypothetical protein
MENVFERLAKSSRNTVERVHGKAVTIYPVSKRDPNASPALDADSPPWPTVALFYQEPRQNEESGRYSQPTADSRRMVQRAAQMQASIRLVDGKPLRNGFFFQRTADQAIFQIVSFDADGMGNVMASVVPAQALPE